MVIKHKGPRMVEDGEDCKLTLEMWKSRRRSFNFNSLNISKLQQKRVKI